MFSKQQVVIAGATATSLILFISLHSPSQAAVKNAAYSVHEKVTTSWKPTQEQPYCKWVFDRYESSPYEQEWLDLTNGGVNDQVCQVSAQPAHARKMYKIIERVVGLVNLDHSIQWPRIDTAAPEPAHVDDSLFSKFYYKRVCYNTKKHEFEPALGVGIQLIEPLFGLLRDPFDWWCGEDNLSKQSAGQPPGYVLKDGGQSKLHILPQGYAPYTYSLDGSSEHGWRQHGIPPWYKTLKPQKDGNLLTFSQPQVVHLDLGSSYFGGWTNMGSGERNAAASGQWFYDTYHARGQPFDRFTAVELEPLDPATAYKQVPEDLIGKYNLINIGLSMDKDKYNTMDLIRRTVNKEDFFVFKLDIDSAPIEMPIVNELLRDDPETGVSSLIDELMFEHHVKFKPMDGPWGLQHSTEEKEGNLASSYKLFRDLRAKGIRAHSWP
ncbi:hypothetical protein BCR37DRAFT_378725 [Protomyces lactucae-debilis]|uniref:Uncharacterized protein n=1 Tax=Protomyces lactucae-debilis TaxID=2754530 RepID=A0A1Y2FIG8_PROLT|nr:uncharacterized protein BCR37DRAFT_378725 [Protomyces lactucae-debilis]ORY83750.1 hypothetical protein BCR37DRAFT_378725 [Protomyces lactucae-debilis]